MAVKFDTLRYAQTRQAGGFTEPQAAASATALGLVLEESIPVTLGDLATKNELLDARLALSKDIAQCRSDLSKEIAQCRADLSKDIAQCRADLSKDITRVRQDLSDRIARLDGERWVVRWMLATTLTGVGAILVKLFL